MRPAALAACLAASLGLPRACGGLRVERAWPQCREQWRGQGSGKVIPEENWVQAAREEGLDPDKISLFGRLAPKVPRSVVKRWEANYAPSLKTLRYSFIGSSDRPLNTNAPDWVAQNHHSRRMWAMDFAKKRFSGRDFLSIVDVPRNHTPLGSFDYSSFEDYLDEDKRRRLLRARMNSEAEGAAGLLALSGEDKDELDWHDREVYLRVAAKSDFALCPGGDGPWSARSFEVPFLRALPVIDQPKQDWCPLESTGATMGVYQAILDRMHYVKTRDAPFTVYNPFLAEANYRVAIKYMTFMEGDNEIPGLKPCMLGQKAVLLPNSSGC